MLNTRFEHRIKNTLDQGTSTGFSTFWPLANRHIQTMLPHTQRLKRQLIAYNSTERVIECVSGRNKFRSMYPEDSKKTRGHILVVPGIEGRCDVHSLSGLLNGAFQQRFAIHCMNRVGCDSSFPFGGKIFHGGFWEDIYRSLQALPRSEPCFVLGLSLGGHCVLKMVGELGMELECRTPAVASISAPLELYSLERTMLRNPFYHRFLITLINQRYRRYMSRLPSWFRKESGFRTHREYDEYVTIRQHAFESVETYYDSQSCEHVLGRINTPTLVITSKDDPITPWPQYMRNQNNLRSNHKIELCITDTGGHVGFFNINCGFWAYKKVLSFFESYL